MKFVFAEHQINKVPSYGSEERACGKDRSCRVKGGNRCSVSTPISPKIDLGVQAMGVQDPTLIQFQCKKTLDSNGTRTFSMKLDELLTNLVTNVNFRQDLDLPAVLGTGSPRLENLPISPDSVKRE